MKLYVVAAIALVNVACASVGGRDAECKAGVISDNGYP